MSAENQFVSYLEATKAMITPTPLSLAKAALSLNAGELEEFLFVLGASLSESANEIAECWGAPTPLSEAAALIEKAAKAWSTRIGD